jgi:protein phosphatase
MRLDAHASTDPGPVRDNNEDALFVDADAGLFAVADGMGGHASGEVASQIAVDTIRDILESDGDPDETRLERAAAQPGEAVRERIRYAMNQASLRIRRAAQQNPIHAGMGTTLAVLLVDGPVAHYGHVGDSRIYHYRDGQLTRLTRDHTVVQQEVDAGRLTPELARLVPHKNILTQSVGYHGPVEPDTATRPIQPGDLFLLCSDGLTDPFDDATLADTLRRLPADEGLADELVRHAIAAGSEDNVTVVIVRVLA